MDYVTIAVGIITSALSFYVTYIKTIGAKNERINSTYEDIVKILIRNLVNSDYIPSFPEINRILTAKSIERKFNVCDLPDEVIFIYALYAKIAEDEIISSDNKINFIKKINSYLDTNERDSDVTDKEELKLIDREKIFRTLLILSSLIIAIPFVLISLSTTENTFTYSTFILTIVTILLTLIILNLFLKLREEQEEPKASRKSVFEDYRNYEDRVYKILKNFRPNKEVRIKNNNRRLTFDLSFKTDGKIFLVEVKIFRSYIPKVIIDKLMYLANSAKETNKNYVLILVVNEKKYLRNYIIVLKEIWDYIFDEEELKKFRNELMHKKT